MILFAFALAVTLMLASFGYCFQSRKRKKLRAATRRVATMSFDLEGGSPAAGAAAAGILDACAKGDVFAIKAWIADERCVIDAASKEGSLTAPRRSQSGPRPCDPAARRGGRRR